jgi:hypothetical protein
MKSFALCLLLFVVGCPQSAKFEQLPKTERERLTRLWDKVKTLAIAHDTTPQQLTELLGPPDAKAPDDAPDSYRWGDFEALSPDMTAHAHEVLYVQCDHGFVRLYRKTRPIYEDGGLLRFESHACMTWSGDRFI